MARLTSLIAAAFLVALSGSAKAYDVLDDSRMDQVTAGYFITIVSPASTQVIEAPGTLAFTITMNLGSAVYDPVAGTITGTGGTGTTITFSNDRPAFFTRLARR